MGNIYRFGYTLDEYFSDPDRDELRYTAATSDSRTVSVEVQVTGADAYLWVRLVAAGTAEGTVTARDPDDLTAAKTITVHVQQAPNQPPVASREPVTLTPQARYREETVSLVQYFSDPDGDVLSYAAETSDPGTVMVWVSGSTLLVLPVTAGTATLTITARDPDDLTATKIITVQVPNQPPTVALTSRVTHTLQAGGPELTVSLDEYFSDPDGDALSYAAETSDSRTVRVQVSGATLVLTPVAAGTATLTITARDPDDETADKIITVQVQGVVTRPGDAPVLFSDDFESYAVGSLPTNYVIVDDGYGTAEQRVEEEGGTRHLRTASRWGLEMRKDLDFDLPSVVSVSWRMRVDNDLDYRITDGTGVGYAEFGGFRVKNTDEIVAAQSLGLFKSGSDYKIVARCPAGYGTRPVLQLGTWAEFRMEVDFAAGRQSMFKDGVKYCENDTGRANPSFSGNSWGESSAISLVIGDGGSSVTRFDDIVIRGGRSSPTEPGPPQAAGTAPGLTLQAGAPDERVWLDQYFSDPDGDALSYTADTSDSRTATVRVSEATLLVKGVAAGTATVTVTARDRAGLTATQTFTVRVQGVAVLNRVPEAVGPALDLTLQAGGSEERVSLGRHFSDPDGDVLSYTATSDSRTAMARVSGATLVVTPVLAGTATVTITGRDPSGLTATKTITVLVQGVANPSGDAVVFFSDNFSSGTFDKWTTAGKRSVGGSTGPGRLSIVDGVVRIEATAGGNYTVTIEKEIRVERPYDGYRLSFDWKGVARETPYGRDGVHLHFFDDEDREIGRLVAYNLGWGSRGGGPLHNTRPGALSEDRYGGIGKFAETFDWERVTLTTSTIPGMDPRNVARLKLSAWVYNDAGSGGEMHFDNFELRAGGDLEGPANRPADAVVLYSDDFESHAVGSLPADYVIVYNGRGTAEQRVEDEGGNRHLRTAARAGWSLAMRKDLDFDLPGVVSASWRMRVDNDLDNYSYTDATSGRFAHFGGFGVKNTDELTAGIGIHKFESDRKIVASCPEGGGTRPELQLSTWTEFRMDVDFAAGRYSMFKDGVKFCENDTGRANLSGRWNSWGESSAIHYASGNSGSAITRFDDVVIRGGLARVEPALDRLATGDRFRDCADCPEMVVIPAGSFLMGSPSGEAGRFDDEGPAHRVTISEPFAVGVYEVTFDEWDACVADGGCGGRRPGDEGWGRGRRPVVNVSWRDAQSYVSWLSETTGEPYRLLSESEWEYAARAGTETAYSWGNGIGRNRANCDGCGSQWDDDRTAPVGSFPANGFGLHDMQGNAHEFAEDCANGGYGGAPTDGSAWLDGDCSRRVVRGGSTLDGPGSLRSAKRGWHPAGFRDPDGDGGFRLARTLTPTGPGANQPPVASSSLRGFTAQGVNTGELYETSLDDFFRDPEGGALSYTAETSDSRTVRVQVEGALLTVTPVAAGTATVTITARDPPGLTAIQTITVPVRGVATRPGDAVVFFSDNFSSGTFDKWTTAGKRSVGGSTGPGRLSIVDGVVRIEATAGGNYTVTIEKEIRVERPYDGYRLSFDWKGVARETPYGRDGVHLHFFDDEDREIGRLVAYNLGWGSRGGGPLHNTRPGALSEDRYGGIGKFAETFDWERVTLTTSTIPGMDPRNVARLKLSAWVYNDAGSGGEMHFDNFELRAGGDLKGPANRPADAVVLYSDDFESHAVGSLPADYVIVYNGRGTAEQRVEDEGGNRHLRTAARAGWSLAMRKDLDFDLPGVVSASWRMRVDNDLDNYSYTDATSGRFAHFGGFGVKNTDELTAGIGIHKYESDRKIVASCPEGGGTRPELQLSTWTEFRMDVDFAAGRYSMFKDGVKFCENDTGRANLSGRWNSWGESSAIHYASGNSGSAITRFDDVVIRGGSPSPTGPGGRPQAAGTALGLTLQAGGSEARESLDQYFSDPDGDALSYGATTSDSRTATVRVSGTTLAHLCHPYLQVSYNQLVAASRFGVWHYIP